MWLPLGACLGNFGTEFCFIVGRTFRNVPQPESVSQYLRSKWDGVSAVHLLAKRPPELLLWRPFVYLQMRALVVLGQALDVVGDHVFLVCGDDHDRDGRAGGADDLRAVAHGLAVLVVVDAHAQPLEAVAEGLAD